MPTYAYECGACGHRLEEFQSMTAAPLRKCPACRRQKLQRLIGAGSGVIFKGSGFYQTDYKKSGSEPAAAGGNSAEGKDKPAKAGGEPTTTPTKTPTSDKPAKKD